VLQATVGRIRALRWGARAVTNRPVLLMAGSTILNENLKRCHVVPSELQSRLRMAGIRHPGEVSAVVLETSGTVSVLRRGEPLDPMLLRGVVGGSEVPQELLAHEADPSWSAAPGVSAPALCDRLDQRSSGTIGPASARAGASCGAVQNPRARADSGGR